MNRMNRPETFVHQQTNSNNNISVFLPKHNWKTKLERSKTFPTSIKLSRKVCSCSLEMMMLPERNLYACLGEGGSAIYEGNMGSGRGNNLISIYGPLPERVWTCSKTAVKPAGKLLKKSSEMMSSAHDSYDRLNATLLIRNLAKRQRELGKSQGWS